MLQVEMNAAVRTGRGKGAMRQLRMKGITPAVVYGSGAEGISLQLETQPLFQKLLKVYRRNAVVTLKLDDGTTKNVLIKDVQTDPIKDTLIHVDFHEIDISVPRVFQVPVNYTGNAKGCDLGGVLNIVKDTIAVEAAPLDVPDDFTINITNMKIGDSIKVETVEIPQGVNLITAAEDVCVSVLSPKRGTDKEETEGEAAEE
jgi:large subunit ribosomal protein L25